MTSAMWHRLSIAKSPKKEGMVREKQQRNYLISPNDHKGITRATQLKNSNVSLHSLFKKENEMVIPILHSPCPPVWCMNLNLTLYRYRQLAKNVDDNDDDDDDNGSISTTLPDNLPRRWNGLHERRRSWQNAESVSP